MPVADARDIPRALAVLHARLWLAGHGAVRVSDAGQPLLRSPIDLAMRSPVQPVFLRAHLGPGLEQRKGFWWCPAADAELALLDTVTALPDLTDAERARLQTLQRQAIEDAAQAIADARAAYTERRLAELMARGVAEPDAQAQIAAALDAGDLYGDWPIPLASGQTVTVADILADPVRYHGQACRDPIEPEYGGRAVAKVYSAQPKPVIRSHAHGGRTFHLHAMTRAGMEQLAAGLRSKVPSPTYQAGPEAEAPPPAPAEGASLRVLPLPPMPQPLDLAELASRDWPPTTWAVEGLLPAGQVTLLSANGGVGKSIVSLQMAVAVATGSDFLGLKARAGRALIVSAEDGAAIMLPRLAHAAAAAGVSLADLADSITAFDATACDATLWTEAGPTGAMSWLARVANEQSPALIVVDNASDVFAGNENDRSQVRGFMRALRLIAEDSGAALLLLAHVDKASVRLGLSAETLSSFSGSTAWNNSARSRLAMSRDGDMVSLRHEKANLGPLQPDMTLEFDRDARVFRLAGTVPGLAAARELLRNQQRAAVLRLIHQVTRAGKNVSTRVSANNNAYLMLREEADFPAALSRGDFFRLLAELQGDGLVKESAYVGENRKRAHRLELTDAGALRVATGSGAPAMWRGQAAA